jgi:soluble lytic murein transglycosylase-like protein
LCFCNPLVHFWLQWISEVQEFACDEAMVDRKQADPQVYARCLAEAAQTALLARHEPVCATGFLFASRRNLLVRRIATMFTTEKRKPTSPYGAAVVLLAAALALSATAFATKDWIQDKRITLAQAEVMERTAQAGTKFPIVLNEDVLRELNRYLGTSEGRDFVRQSLRRMRSYDTLVQAKIHSYGLPEELMAIALVESGYKNERVSTKHGAGLWQFIASTARRYGLGVNEEQDQRFNETLATDAALRYLSANHQRFKDWPLAIMAYNAGEERVQQGLNETGTDDAWALIKAGFEGDRGYLARVMAAVLILKNPRSVD